MEESLKSRIILILSVLTVIFFLSTISSCTNTLKQKRAKDKEMVTRLDLEERMGHFNQEKSALENKVNELMQELEKEKAQHEATKKSLAEEQLIAQSLKNELDKVIKLKETLEEDLKDALADKSGKSKRR